MESRRKKSLAFLLLAAVLSVSGAACAASRPIALEVTLPVANYSPMMSSVPGLPIAIRAESGAAVELTVGQGELLRWGQDTESKVLPQGSSLSFESSGNERTFYWSPLLDGSGAVVEIPAGTPLRVTVTATIAGRPTKVTVVEISMNEGFYTAKVA